MEIELNSWAIGFEDTLCSLLKKYMEDSKELYEGKVDVLRISTIGSAIGTHVGPGAIAFAFFTK